MKKEIKKIWIKKGNSFIVFVARYPYTEKDIIKEGLPYNEWIKTKFIKE